MRGIEPRHGGPQPPRLPLVYTHISAYIYPTSASACKRIDFNYFKSLSIILLYILAFFDDGKRREGDLNPRVQRTPT